MRVTIEDDSGRIQTFTVTQDLDMADAKAEVVEHYKPYSDGTKPALDVREEDNIPCDEAEDPGYKCFLCEGFVHPENDWCFGCRCFICTEHIQTPWGPHLPDDHDKP